MRRSIDRRDPPGSGTKPLDADLIPLPRESPRSPWRPHQATLFAGPRCATSQSPGTPAPSKDLVRIADGEARRRPTVRRRRMLLRGNRFALWHGSTHQIGGALRVATAFQLTAGGVGARLAIRHAADRNVFDACALTAHAALAALAVGTACRAHCQATLLLLFLLLLFLCSSLAHACETQQCCCQATSGDANTAP